MALALALGLGLASSAQAGFFGLNALAAEDAIKEDARNSQNLPVLQAPSSPLLAFKDKIDGTEVEIKLESAALVPENGPSGTAADVAGSDYDSDAISLYVVKKGDTVASVAKMFGVSQNTVIWANDLARAAALKEGATLIILPITGVQHAVKRGETLAAIVKKYKGDLDEVLRYNGLTEETRLAEGDIIFIPDGEVAAPAAPSGRKGKLIGAGGPEFPDYYIRPLAPGVGRRSQGLHGRNGIDLAAPRGTPILASAGGNVLISDSAGYNGGYGKYVVLTHGNGTQTLYAHMNSTALEAGQSVARGEVIGYVGSTGKSTGNHVHFEVRGARNPGVDNSWAR